MYYESFILAGGKSSRMGSDKVFLEFSGKTLLENAFDILQRIESHRIFAVITEESDRFADFPTIADIYNDRGTLGGIHVALQHCQEKFTVILAVDLPFVSADMLNFLLEIAEQKNAEAVAPIQKDGFIQPLCAVYQTRNCLKTLTEILERSDKTPSATEFLKQINTHFIEFEKFANLPNAENFFININTKIDFAKATEIFNER